MATVTQRVVPGLRITDYARSKAFYVDGLGFSIEWEHRFEPQLPVFMSIVRDGLQVFLSEHSGDCEVGGLVYFFVSDVDACYAELQQRQIVVKEPPNERIKGIRSMTVVDPDGNQLRFILRIRLG